MTNLPPITPYKMKTIATALAPTDDRPWLAEPSDDGFYRVVNDLSVVIAQKCVKEEAELFAASPDLLEKLEEMVEMAGSVNSNWENGNLSEAVNNLNRVAGEAKSILKRAYGKAA